MIIDTAAFIIVALSCVCFCVKGLDFLIDAFDFLVEELVEFLDKCPILWRALIYFVVLVVVVLSFAKVFYILRSIP